MDGSLLLRLLTFGRLLVAVAVHTYILIVSLLARNRLPSALSRPIQCWCSITPGQSRMCRVGRQRCIDRLVARRRRITTVDEELHTREKRSSSSSSTTDRHEHETPRNESRWYTMQGISPVPVPSPRTRTVPSAPPTQATWAGAAARAGSRARTAAAPGAGAPPSAARPPAPAPRAPPAGSSSRAAAAR